MLKNKLGLSMGWAGALVCAVVVFGPACGGTGETGGSCTPNQQESCACPGDKSGVQTCNRDGTAFGICECEGASSNSGGGGTGGDGGFGGGPMGACGDGIEDQGECDPGAESYCPEDCKPGTGGTGGTGGGTGGDPCEGHVTYAGLVGNVPAAWGQHPDANSKTGFEAGIAICATLGADHPCTYEEMRLAETAGELANIAQGTAAWIHRTMPEMVGGTPSAAGPGGRCNDWVYTTNHISDGEYATFDMVGIPSYHLDNDTFYDGVDTTHTIANDLQCGGQMRAILCCFPTCSP